jgi:hypothetical protein
VLQKKVPYAMCKAMAVFCKSVENKWPQQKSYKSRLDYVLE